MEEVLFFMACVALLSGLVGLVKGHRPRPHRQPDWKFIGFISPKIGQDLERFAPQSADAPGSAQLTALRVEGTLAEDVPHGGQPPPCAKG